MITLSNIERLEKSYKKTLLNVIRDQEQEICIESDSLKRRNRVKDKNQAKNVRKDKISQRIEKYTELIDFIQTCHF